MRLRTMLSRRFLVSTACAAPAGWIGWKAAPCRADSTAPSDRNALLALCAELPSGAAAGAACRAALPPREGSEAALLDAILASLPQHEDGHRPAQDLRHRIAQRSRADFRNNAVVAVDGWMLSLTETRVYALAALLRSGRDRHG